MAFAGLCGLNIKISVPQSINVLELLFAEEIGWVLEVKSADLEHCLKLFKLSAIDCHYIGQSKSSGMQSSVKVMLQIINYIFTKSLIFLI